MLFQTTQYDSAHFQSLGKVTIVTKAARVNNFETHDPGIY